MSYIKEYPKKEKEIECSKCKCLIAFFEHDIIEIQTGIQDVTDGINCPNCKENIILNNPFK